MKMPVTNEWLKDKIEADGEVIVEAGTPKAVGYGLFDAAGKMLAWTDNEGFATVTWKPERVRPLYADIPTQPQAHAPREPGVLLPHGALIKLRDALIARDSDEAYYLLYAAVDPEFSKLNPWAEAAKAVQT